MMAFRGWMLVVAIDLCCWSGNFVHLTNVQSPPAVTCSGGNSSCLADSAFSPWPDRQDCKAAAVVYPTTEKELIVAVAEAVKARRKMRVISKGAHSTPKLVCPRGNEGLFISTRDYNRNIIVDTKKLTATLDAGVRLKPFFDTVAQYGLAFPHSPYWAGLSISGVISTGAHGSSLWGKGSAVNEYVVGMRIVVPAPAAEGYAKVITLTEADEDLKAARLSMGLLGVISTVTLRLQPQFKRALSMVQKSDHTIGRELTKNALQYEFGDVTWHPAMKTVTYREDNRDKTVVNPTGTNNYTAFGWIPIEQSQQGRATEEFFEATRNESGKCTAGAQQLQVSQSIGFGYNNNGTAFTGWPVYAYQNDMQTFGNCDEAPFAAGYSCSWDRRINGSYFFMTGLIIPFSDILDFIKDIKTLVARNPTSLCGLELYNGILMRYVKKSEGAYLGLPFDGVDMDIVFYRSHDPYVPTLNQDIYDEIEQILVFKYKSRPHVGKGRPTAYINSHEKFQNLIKFLRVKNRYDPYGYFSNEWTDKVLNINGANHKVLVNKPYCALEGLCICSKDIHCAPEANYFCRPGQIYKKARVCRYEPKPSA